MCDSNEVLMTKTDARSQGSALRSRLKLWEINHSLHCAIIGTCLSISDLHRACARTYNDINDIDTDVSDYELHKRIVHVSRKPLQITRYLHKTLDRKHRAQIRSVGRIWAGEELQQYWDESVKHGEVPGAFWALVTHPATTDDLLDTIYGEVHMLSHRLGKGRHQELQNARVTHKQLQYKDQKLRAMSAEIQDKSLVIQHMQDRIKQLESERDEWQGIQQQLQDYQSGSVLAALRGQADDLAEKLAASRMKVIRLKEYAENWKQRHHKLLHTQEYGVSGKVVALDAVAKSPKEASQSELGDQCSDCDLRGQCVLYVGGRQSQCSHFRQIVEQQNGKFLYHDGGLEQSASELDSVLGKADVVFCPVDCVSHAAMHKVKEKCRDKDVSVQFLKTSSISLFSRALRQTVNRVSCDA